MNVELTMQNMFEKFLVETLKLAPRQMWGVEQLGVYFKKLFSANGAKAAIACIVAIAELIGLVVFDFATTPRGEALDLSGYSLVFEDEFEYGYGVYGYEFVLKITKDGEAYAISHLTDKPREIVIKERIITDWKSIKKRIKESAELYTNFEV